VGLKGMSVAVLIALAWPAQAADDVRCSGVWFHDGNRDRVGHCIYQIRYGRIPAHRSISVVRTGIAHSLATSRSERAIGTSSTE
jgi:hypothetical protein